MGEFEIMFNQEFGNRSRQITFGAGGGAKGREFYR